MLHHIANHSTWCCRIHRIEQFHRHIRIFSRQNTSWVQNFRTKICQLSRLIKVQMTHWCSILHETRVIIVHTIYIGPNLNLRRAQRTAYERSSIVATTTLQIIDITSCIQADKTLSDIDILVRMRCQLFLQLLLNILLIWFAIFVGTHKFQSRQQHCIVSLF